MPGAADVHAGVHIICITVSCAWLAANNTVYGLELINDHHTGRHARPHTYILNVQRYLQLMERSLPCILSFIQGPIGAGSSIALTQTCVSLHHGFSTLRHCYYICRPSCPGLSLVYSVWTTLYWQRSVRSSNPAVWCISRCTAWSLHMVFHLTCMVFDFTCMVFDLWMIEWSIILPTKKLGRCGLTVTRLMFFEWGSPRSNEPWGTSQASIDTWLDSYFLCVWIISSAAMAARAVCSPGSWLGTGKNRS